MRSAASNPRVVAAIRARARLMVDEKPAKPEVVLEPVTFRPTWELRATQVGTRKRIVPAPPSEFLRPLYTLEQIAAAIRRAARRRDRVIVPVRTRQGVIVARRYALDEKGRPRRRPAGPGRAITAEQVRRVILERWPRLAALRGDCDAPSSSRRGTSSRTSTT